MELQTIFDKLEILAANNFANNRDRINLKYEIKQGIIDLKFNSIQSGMDKAAEIFNKEN